jgi:hypothetical protein
MKVTKEFYDIGGRKYIELDYEQIKVPWRYGRVMCSVLGLQTVQELKLGQEVHATITLKFWEGQQFRVLKELSTL